MPGYLYLETSGGRGYCYETVWFIWGWSDRFQQLPVITSFTVDPAAMFQDLGTMSQDS